MSRNVTPLSTQDLIDQEKGPIWVINNTEEAIGSGGDVFVTVNQNGQNRSLSVPQTWLAVEVTRMIPRKYVLDSSYFLEALGKELLIAISEEDAKAINGSSGADREMKRLGDKEAAVKAALAAKGISRNVSVVNTDSTDSDDQPVKAKTRSQKSGVSVIGGFDEEDLVPASEVSTKFKAWVNKINLIEDQEDAIAELRQKSQLDEDECQYLIDNCKHDRIVNGLKKKLEAH